MLSKYWVAISILLSTLVGCQRQQLDFVEVKRIHEPLTEAELAKVSRIIRGLPNKNIPEFPALFAPLPQWEPTKTLSVSKMVANEQDRIQRQWDEEKIGRRLRQDQRLMRLLAKEEMTPEQFVGLMQTICVAAARSRVRDDQDLEDISRKAVGHLKELRDNDESFAVLSPDEQFYANHQAGWLTRLDRAERLLLVPEENTEFVKRHEELLRQILPETVFENPFDAIVDHLDEYGQPFKEIAESGYDAELTWDPEAGQALVGKARSDDLVANAK